MSRGLDPGLDVLDLGCGHGWLAERMRQAELAIASGLVITGIHEPPSLPHTDIPPAEWTDYQRWFSTIPTTPAISCAPSARSRPTPRDR
ncbi:hypothetical protein ACWEKT_25260 [Nocardia takedensis]